MATQRNSKNPAGSTPSASVRADSSLHVEPKNGSWAVRKDRRVASTHATRGQAVVAARSIARKEHAEVLIHAADGRVKHRLSHSAADDIMMGVWENTSAGEARQPKA